MRRDGGLLCEMSLMVDVKIRMKVDLAVMKEEGRKEGEEAGGKRRIYS